MGVSQDQLQRAIDAAHVRVAEGYFEVVRAGDRRASSLFVRLVAYDLNPLGAVTGYGWLTKSPGETQYEGWSEDAIVLGGNPADLENVVDLVSGAGAPGADIGGEVKERRPNNKWVKPKALSQDDMDYLRSGGMPEPEPEPPQPQPPTYPGYEELGGDEGGKKVTRLMETDYRHAGKDGLDGDSGAWQWRTAYDFLTRKYTTVEQSIAAHQPEWRQSLNDERTSQGKPPIAW